MNRFFRESCYNIGSVLMTLFNVYLLSQIMRWNDVPDYMVFTCLLFFVPLFIAFRLAKMIYFEEGFSSWLLYGVLLGACFGIPTFLYFINSGNPVLLKIWLFHCVVWCQPPLAPLVLRAMIATHYEFGRPRRSTN